MVWVGCWCVHTRIISTQSGQNLISFNTIERCLEFVGEWAEEVMETEAWPELSFENALRVVSSDLVAVSEYKLLLAVLRWGWPVLTQLNCPLPSALTLKRTPSGSKSLDAGSTATVEQNSPVVSAYAPLPPTAASPAAVQDIALVTEQLKSLLVGGIGAIVHMLPTSIIRISNLLHSQTNIRLPLLCPSDLHEVVHPLSDAGLIPFHSLLEAYRFHVDPSLVPDLPSARIRTAASYRCAGW